MTSTVSKLSASPRSIASDGSQNSVVTAAVLTDGKTAVAGVTVNWQVTGGEQSAMSSVTDDKGNATIEVFATSTTITVLAKTDDDTVGKTTTISTYKPFAAPVVMNATVDDGNTLDHYDIKFGVQAEIPWFNGAALNEQITFYWGDVDNLSFIITESKLPPFVIDVSKEMSPDCLKDGIYDVYYVVKDPSGNLTQSSKVNITVADGGQTVPTLPAPEVGEADPYINIVDADDGVEMKVSYKDMKEGDVITIYWVGYDKQRRKVDAAYTSETYTVTMGEVDHTFTIDSSVFYPNDRGYEGYAEAYYTVQLEDSTVLDLSDTLTCLVDTVAP